jgi:F-type H+-transporting ATPase subunit a
MTFTTSFSIGKPIITMWVIIAVLTILSILATRRLKDVPGPLQNVAEAAVEKLEDYFGGTLGYDNMRRYFGIFATLFIFIVVSNYSGLLPTAGETFSVPTASISVTAALAVIAFFTTHTIGIQRNGLGGYAKSFLKPIAFLLPLTLLDQIVRPFSLAIRLYGNIYAEEMVTAQLRKMFPVLLPLVMQILGLLFCLIQAMVFTMLTAVYVHEAIGDDE